MNDLFLAVVAILVIGMMVMMIKYAKFIHKQPKIEEERRKEENKENSMPDENS